MPQRNALPGLVFIVLFAIGLLVAYPSGSAGDYATSVTIAIVSFIVASILASAVKVADQWERAVVLRLGRFQQARRAGPLLHHSDHRHDPLLDRHPRHHQHLQGGKDADQRHRAGRRRRGPVLEGDRPAEGGARRRRLRRGDQLGRADGAARRDRQDHARRHARGARQDQRRTAAASSTRAPSRGASTSSRSRSRTC